MKMSLSFGGREFLILAPVFILTDLTRAKEGGEERKARPGEGGTDTLSWQRAGDRLAERRQFLGPGLCCKHHGKA